MSPISSRKSVPRAACAKSPDAGLLGVRERAARVAEELALEQRLGHRCAIDGHERALAPAAALVEDVSDHLLSRYRSRR
jgi:hypothetical protein